MERGREIVLSIRDLSVSFHAWDGEVHAVRGVEMDLYKGETVAVVGESGSGKSAMAKAVMGILGKEGTVSGGQIQFTYHREGEVVREDLLKLTNRERRKRINGKRIAMVFQDPMTSLDPTMSIGRQIMEGMMYHYKIPRKVCYEKAVRLLELVGIAEPEQRMKSYPHQLSGGMRQRVVIAIALACDPQVLICDEPTTALDVTIQARVLELIREIQVKTGISVIYITHDLGVVAKVADYVLVMYAGKIMEKGLVDEVFYDPRHPYTWGLLSSMPDLEMTEDRLYAIPGNPIDQVGEAEGDAFAKRNPYALNIDYRLEPPMFRVTDTHYAATWLLSAQAPKVEMPEGLRARIQRMKKGGGAV